MFNAATYALTDENGDGFAMVRHTDGACDLRIKERGAVVAQRHLPVQWGTEYPDEFWRLLEYWLSTALAILADREEGEVRHNLAVDTYYNQALNLGMMFDPGCRPEDVVTVSLWTMDDSMEDLDIDVTVTVTKDELWSSIEDLNAHFPNV